MEVCYICISGSRRPAVLAIASRSSGLFILVGAAFKVPSLALRDLDVGVVRAPTCSLCSLVSAKGSIWYPLVLH